MKSIMLAALLLAAIVDAHANGLRPFQDSTLARADDVNHNFGYLDDRIDEIVSRIESPEVTEVVNCDSNPDALQQAIEKARGLNSLLSISASGNCNRINVANQQVSISNGGNLTINNSGGSDATAPTVTVREAGVLAINGYPLINGGANTAISIYGQSYFVGAYLQISGGVTGILASWSNFILLGNVSFNNTINAMVLNSSTGLFLGKLSTGNVYTCDGSVEGPPACLTITNPSSFSTAFSLNNSRLALGSENTQIIISANEASMANHSSLDLRNGSLALSEEFKIEGSSIITATGTAGETLSLTSDIQLTENSVVNLDYDNTDDPNGRGNFEINGNIEVNLGSVLNVNGSSENGQSKVLFKENLTVLAGKAVLTDTKMQLGSQDVPAEINVIGGQLIMDGLTFDKLPSPSNAGAPDINVLQSGTLTLIHNNDSDPTPSCSDIDDRVAMSFDGKTYYLPFENVNAVPHDYGDFCNSP